MRLRAIRLGTALSATLALAACDASKSELDRTRGELAAANTERDGLKSQLEAEKIHTADLAGQVAALNGKLAAAQSQGTGKSAANQASAPAVAKKGDKPAKHATKSTSKAAHDPAQKG